MLTSSMASVRPTANASMLVATASMISVPPRDGSVSWHSPSRVEPGAHHAAADKGEQAECDPVVKRGDVLSDERAAEPTEDRHQGLEQAEMKRQAKDRARPVDEARCSGAQADRERIHRQAEGDEQDFNEAHSGEIPSEPTAMMRPAYSASSRSSRRWSARSRATRLFGMASHRHRGVQRWRWTRRHPPARGG